MILARPKKCGQVCREPIISNFVPKDIDSPKGEVVLSANEYEVDSICESEKK